MNSSPTARGWLDAIARPEVYAAVRGVYDAAAVEIERRGPACWASGRCCNFEKAGHRLYVTGLEAAFVVQGLGGVAGAANQHTGLMVWANDGAGPAKGCVFQERNLCTVHAIKPLACRVYFCDESAQRWQQELLEGLIADVRSIHDRFGVEYHYGEWKGVLAMFLGEAG